MDVRGAPPDAEVVALVLAGDTEAFGIVIRRYEAGLLRFATRMLGSRDAAADAVAESFVRAYRHLASCREPARTCHSMTRRPWRTQPTPRRTWSGRTSFSWWNGRSRTCRPTSARRSC